MTTKHLTPEQLAVYAEHLQNENLQNVDASHVAHVKDCDACAHEIIFLTEMLADENSFKQQTNAKTADKKNKRYISWLAAAAVLTILTSLTFLLHTFDKTTPDFAQQAPTDTIVKQPVIKQNTLAKSDTTTTQKNKTPENSKPVIIKPKPKLKLAYVPNNQLEALVQRFDNGALRGIDISVKSPTTIVTKSSLVQLSWSNQNKIPLLVALYNNNGEKIKETETTDSVFQIKNTLPAGLYYWKLIDAEEFDLLFCGKIKIEP